MPLDPYAYEIAGYRQYACTCNYIVSAWATPVLFADLSISPDRIGCCYEMCLPSPIKGHSVTFAFSGGAKCTHANGMAPGLIDSALVLQN